MDPDGKHRSEQGSDALCVGSSGVSVVFAANEVVCTRFATPVNIPGQYTRLASVYNVHFGVCFGVKA